MVEWNRIPVNYYALKINSNERRMEITEQQRRGEWIKIRMLNCPQETREQYVVLT